MLCRETVLLIDLHTHTTASDGTTTPAALVRQAAAEGLSVLGLTDHDTTAGWAEAVDALPPGLTLVRGTELSCGVQTPSRRISLHLLAYLFDPDEPNFAAELTRLRTDRIRRAEQIVLRLQELGAPVTLEQVRRNAGQGAVGQPHIAQALVQAGVIASQQEAFSPSWIGSGGRAYVPKHSLPVDEALALVIGAGGVPVFAHPAAGRRGPIVDDDVYEMMAAHGLVGVEIDHPDHNAEERARLQGIAKALGLVRTGSSDFHGANKSQGLAAETTAPDQYEALLAAARGVAPVAA